MNGTKLTGRRRLALVAAPDWVDSQGPTSVELAEIEAEWPLIAAELDVVDAECVMARRDVVTDWDRRKLRRAKDRVLRVAAELRRPAAWTGRATAGAKAVA